MRSFVSKTTLAVAALLLGYTMPSIAQTASSAPVADQAASAAKPDKAEQKKQAKAQRKAERKEARAKNTAELKKLEAAGYRPGTNDPNYPQSLQDAQKKSDAAGASQ
jgi:hypothetical protein